MKSLTEIEEIVNEATNIIYSSNMFADRGNKRYRILMFAYFYGFVTERDLYYLFLDNELPFCIPEMEMERHANGSILRYLASSKGKSEKILLKRDKQVFYLTSAGVEEIWELIKKLLQVDDLLKDDFLSYRRRRLDSYEHGRIAADSTFLLKHELGICESYQLVEPIIVNGERELQQANIQACRPDAMLFMGNREIYIEADTGKEGYPVIADKLERYANHVLSRDETLSDIDIFFVIHFSWMDNIYKVSSKRYEEVKKIVDGYTFVKDLYPEFEIGFQDYLTRYLKKQKYDFPNDRLQHIYTQKDLEVLAAEEDANYILNERFRLRKRKIEKVVEENAAVRRSLEMGSRFVITPLLLLSQTCKHLLLGRDGERVLIDFVFERFHPRKLVNVKRGRSFIDPISGEEFYFRNCVQVVNEEDKIIWYSFENITMDYGGVCRIKKLLINGKNNAINDLNLIPYYSHVFDYWEIEKYINAYNHSHGSARLYCVDAKELFKRS